MAVLADVGDAELGEDPDVAGREELGDDDQPDLVGGRGRRSAHAAAIRPRTGARLAAISSRRRHAAPASRPAPRAGRSRAVAAVGVEVGRPRGCSRPTRVTSTPAARAGRATPAPMSSAGVPQRSRRERPGTSAATSSRISPAPRSSARTRADRARPRARRRRARASPPPSPARRRAPCRAGRRAPRRSRRPRVGEQHGHAVGGPDHQAEPGGW